MNMNSTISNWIRSLAHQTGEGSAVYFIGIGGIGMSALARYFHSKGVNVSGYDKTETTLTRQLIAEGIQVHYEDRIDCVNQDAKLVIYTPAIPKDHVGLAFVRDLNLPLMKRSEVLGTIINGMQNICVAGTHGKTTTSTMIAHVLRHSAFGGNAFLGGISTNYDTNFWSSDQPWCIAEADEYDRSFLTLHPDIAIITAMDPDHLDIYGNAENVEQAFLQFGSQVKESGTLIIKHALVAGRAFKVNQCITYSVTDEHADAYAANIKPAEGSCRFDAIVKDRIIDGIELPMGGLHNVENAMAAITVACLLSLTDDQIRAAIAAFRGVKRRFEYILKSEEIVLIDDYAHHPDELTALINGVRHMYPERKCNLIFQPHLFSRTRDFADGFAAALDLADEVILLPIYPARELPMEGVSSEMIAAKMNNKNVFCLNKQELLTHMNQEKNNIGLLIMAGAGDIDTIVEPVSQIFKNRLN
jgi:UDP-N-acetylmuramate--alanine ligase